MELQIQSIHFKADQELRKETAERFHKFEKLYNRIEKCAIIFKREKNNTNKKFTVEVQLSVPKENLCVTEHSESLRRAVDKAIDDLKKQIIKHKEKIKPTHRFHKIIYPEELSID